MSGGRRRLHQQQAVELELSTAIQAPRMFRWRDMANVLRNYNTFGSPWLQTEDAVDDAMEGDWRLAEDSSVDPLM